MPRLPRVYIENVLYYATSRGGHNQDVFISPPDYKDYTALINKYKSQYGFKLFTYVLLPTHLHMLIELRNNIGISNIMHDMNSLYTKIFNGRYNKKGHLFQQRFHSVIAEKELYLLPLLRHILLTPKRLKIVDTLKNYTYSSYQQFLDPQKRLYPDLKAEIEDVFSGLKGREAAFEDYILNSNQEEITKFEKELHKRKILGSEQFIERVKKIMKKSVVKKNNNFAKNKLHMVYTVLSGIVAFILTISIFYLYRKHTLLKSEYDYTRIDYEETLETLKQERNKAIKAKRDIQEYVWKIRLTEKALADLEKERALEKKEAILFEKNIEGYAWKISLTQIGGPKAGYIAADTISINNYHVSSSNMVERGFKPTKYSKQELKNGTVVWETIQINEKKETANWRGEWDGKIMRGILSRRFPNGVVQDFSFVSTGEHIKM